MNPHVQQLDEIEAIMDRYVRQRSAEETGEELNRLIDEHNAWMETTKAKHEQARSSLQHLQESLNALEEQIRELETEVKEKPDLRDEGTVVAYNRRVQRHNDLVARYNQQAKTYRSGQERYNAAVTQSQDEMDRRGKQLGERKETTKARSEARREWIRNKQDLSLFKTVNALHAEMATSEAAANVTQLEELRNRTRAVRAELAEYAEQGAQTSPNGPILVRATLCDQEECCYLVDTGATTVTIPAWLVDVLGISDRLGEEIEVSLAGGITITARKLTIPQMSVFGMQAREVEAVVMDEPQAGVDGLLGMSFLSQFTYRIEDGHPDRLLLESKQEK